MNVSPSEGFDRLGPLLVFYRHHIDKYKVMFHQIPDKISGNSWSLVQMVQILATVNYKEAA